MDGFLFLFVCLFFFFLFMCEVMNFWWYWMYFETEEIMLSIVYNVAVKFFKKSCFDTHKAT